MNKALVTLLSSTLLLSSIPALAQEEGNSGFLSDYSVFQRTDDSDNVLLFVKDDSWDRLGEFDSILLDKPVIFISDDSKYKGMDADTMTQLSDFIQGAINEGLAENFKTASAPGSNVLAMRVAASDLYILKQKKRLLGYTPVGLVAGGIKSAVSDFIDKNTLIEMTLEVELQDSETGDVLAAAIMTRGQRKDKDAGVKKDDPAEWEKLHFAFRGAGQRIGCRLNNTKLAEDERADCLAIPLEPAEEE